jgi:hypothetical protein
MPEVDSNIPNPQGVEMMNLATQQVELVPHESVNDAFLSGKYAIDRNSNYKFVSPDGKPMEVSGSNFGNIIREGYRLQTPQEADEERLKTLYGDNSLEAAVEGVGRGLTFGVSDWTLRRLGVSAERLKEIKERNKVAATTGELGGILAPLLLSGGTSAIAEGAAKLGAAPLAVSKLGAKAAEATTKRLFAETLVEAGATKVAAKTLAQAIIEKAAPAAVGSAVEGAFYGAGQLVSESALGNKDFNAENLIAHMGLGALVGGAVGGLLPLPGVLLRRVVGKGDEAAAALAGEAEAVPVAAGEAAPSAGEAAEVAAKATPEDKQIARIGGVDAEDVAHFRANQPRIQENVTKYSLDENAPSKLSDSVMNDLDKFDEHLKTREQAAGDLIEASDLKRDTKQIRKIFQDKIREIKYSGKSDTESGETAINRLQSYVDRFTRKTADGKILNETWDAKRLRTFMQGLWEDNRKFYVPGREQLFEEKAVADVASEINATIKDNVGDEYKNLMKAYAPEVQAFKELRKTWKLTPENVPQMQGWFKNRFQFYLQQLIEGVRNKNEPIINSIKKMGDVVGKDYETIVRDNLVFGRLFPEQAKGLMKGTLTGAFGRVIGGVMRGDIQNVIQNLAFKGGAEAAGSVRNMVYQDLLAKQPSTFSKTISGLYGMTINKLGAIERVLKTQQQAINDGVEGFLSGSKARALPVGITKTLLDVNFGDDNEKPKNRIDALDKHRTQLADIATNQEKLAEKMSSRVDGISEAAPETAQAMMMTAAKGVAFLQSKMPKEPLLEDSIVPTLKKNWRPSDSEISQYERYVRAVNNPTTVVEDMKRGQLTSEGVEAIKAVYPNIYDNVVMEMKKQIAERGKEIPYSRKLQLEMLLGVSLDYTTKPAVIAAMQKSFQQQQPAPSDYKSNRKMSMVENTKTQVEKVISR